MVQVYCKKVLKIGKLEARRRRRRRRRRLRASVATLSAIGCLHGGQRRARERDCNDAMRTDEMGWEVVTGAGERASGRSKVDD